MRSRLSDLSEAMLLESRGVEGVILPQVPHTALGSRGEIKQIGEKAGFWRPYSTVPESSVAVGGFRCQPETRWLACGHTSSESLLGGEKEHCSSCLPHLGKGCDGERSPAALEPYFRTLGI